jgi:hypothetical protein
MDLACGALLPSSPNISMCQVFGDLPQRSQQDGAASLVSFILVVLIE